MDEKQRGIKKQQQKTLQEKISYLESAFLKTGSSKDELRDLCETACNYGFATVCVFPTDVKEAAQILLAKQGKPEKSVEGGEAPKHRVKVCAVVGFPFGENATKIKIAEAKLAIKEGADEIDFVINQTLLKRNDMKAFKNDIIKVAKAVKNKVVKAILEVGKLTDDEIRQCIEICVNAGVTYVKTSTGFFGETTIEQVRTLKKLVADGILIKASGGIDTAQKFADIMYAGQSKSGTIRIGTSKAKEIADGLKANPEIIGLDSNILNMQDDEEEVAVQANVAGVSEEPVKEEVAELENAE